jgi:hypothetical protein
MLMVFLFALLQPASKPIDVHDALTKITALQAAAVADHQAARISTVTFNNVVYATSGAARALTSAMSSSMPGAVYEEAQRARETFRTARLAISVGETKIMKLGPAFDAAERALAGP